MLRTIDDGLEAQYALRQRHPEREEIYLEHRRRSAAVRKGADCQLDVRYGSGPRCLLDVFPASKSRSVFFFIHGGYWRALDKSYVSFIAEPFRKAGMTVVMPTYDLVPSVRVGGIVDQMRAAFNWVLQHLGPERIVVAGHSAGGQLAAMLALDQAARGSGPIVGLAGISGAFDLRPLLHTSINHDLSLSTEEAVEVSPLLRLRRLAAVPLMPFLGIVGGSETNGFKQWTADLVTSWHASGGAATYIEAPDRNHFTVLDTLADSNSEVFGTICDLSA